jgi:hypothetical protein
MSGQLYPQGKSFWYPLNRKNRYKFYTAFIAEILRNSEEGFVSFASSSLFVLRSLTERIMGKFSRSSSRIFHNLNELAILKPLLTLPIIQDVYCNTNGNYTN